MTEPEATEGRHPYGADAPTEDHVGLAFASLPAGVALGTGLVSLTTLVVRVLQRGQPPSGPTDLGAPAVVLLGGTVLSLLAAGTLTWRLLSPTRSPYRQGMLGAVAAFGALLVSLLTAPIDSLFGQPGLAGLAAISLGTALLLVRRIERSR